MDMRGYIDEIKLSMTGGVLELEIDDSTIAKIVNSALREMQRYICSTKLITVPYQKCIDLSSYKINSVTKVFRAENEVTGSSSIDSASVDPIQVGLWQLTSNTGNMYNFNDYISRFASWSAMQQVSNTLSTELSFYYEDSKKRLYINSTMQTGNYVTIEYVPRYETVDEVTSDFWIDVLMRLSKALTKIYVGRIRSRFNQSNSLWTQDGETLLNEGNTELNELRAYLQKNTQLLYTLD